MSVEKEQGATTPGSVSPPHTPLMASNKSTRNVPRNLSFQSLQHRKNLSITPLTPSSRTSSVNHFELHTPVTPSSNQPRYISTRPPRTPGSSTPGSSNLKIPVSPNRHFDHDELTSPVGTVKGEIIPVSIIGYINLGCERQYLMEDENVVSTFDPPTEPEPEPEPPKKPRISVAKAKIMQPEPEIKVPEVSMPEKLVCERCHETLIGAYVRAGDKKYHRKCLVCGMCHTPLEKYFSVTDGSGGERLLCSDCYRLSNPTEKCARCGKLINEESLRVNGMCLHKECFVCSTCGKVLGSRFVTRDGRYYCVPTGKPGPQCFSAGLEALCAACGKPLAGQHAVVTDDEKKYHDHCFVCGICHELLSSQDYYIAELKKGPTLCCESCCSMLE